MALIFLVMMIASCVWLLFTKPDAILATSLNAVTESLLLAVTLAGIYIFWMALAEIATRSGLIDKIAKKHNLKVVYDAAHAFGVTLNDVSSARFGDVSMFSFHATKVFNTIEGGAVCINSDDMLTKLNELKNFGIHGPESVKYIGGNAKMNEFQAAMGICNLKHFDEDINKRKIIYNRYVDRLKSIKGIRLCKPQNNVKYNYAYFPVVFDGFRKSRDEVFELLKKHDVISRKYFYPLISDMECYKGFPTADSSLTPIARFVSDRVLTLPIYSELSIEEVDAICDIILS